MSHRPNQRTASLPALVAAFATIYLVWGSTYLGIRFAVQTLPPLLMSGMRAVIAGSILYAFRRWNGDRRPTPAHWRESTIIGALLLLVGNGTVAWCEKDVPSATVALLIGTTPLWLVLVDWRFYRGQKPGVSIYIGIVLGILGVVLLAGEKQNHRQIISTASIFALLIATGSWAIGSLRSRHHPQHESMLMNSALQMISGGVLLILAGMALGEIGALDWDQISSRSAWAFVYLTLIGSLIGFSTYVWLVKNATPAAVSTYAYVNPMVAVGLGWWLGDEQIGPNTAMAMAVIIGGVVIISLTRKTKPMPQEADGEPGA